MINIRGTHSVCECVFARKFAIILQVWQVEVFNFAQVNFLCIIPSMVCEALAIAPCLKILFLYGRKGPMRFMQPPDKFRLIPYHHY